MLRNVNEWTVLKNFDSNFLFAFSHENAFIFERMTRRKPAAKWMKGGLNWMHACVGVWLDTFNLIMRSVLNYNRWEIIIPLTRANKRLSQIEKLLRKLKLKRKRKESKRIATCKEHLRETRQEYDPTISQNKTKQWVRSQNQTEWRRRRSRIITITMILSFNNKRNSHSLVLFYIPTTSSA